MVNTFTPLIVRQLGLLTIGILALVGCASDLKSGGAPELSLSTDMLLFAAPNQLNEASEVSLSITNTGQSTLIVNPLRIEEEDDTSEVILLDAEDWTAERVSLGVGETRTVRLRWTPTNQQKDRGLVYIESNGGDRDVRFETVDLDPILNVESQVSSDLGLSQGQVTLTTQEASSRIKLTSLGLVPLSISRLCFVDSDDTCLSPTGEVGRGQLELCRSLANETCEPYRLAEALTLLPGEEHSFYVRYNPSPMEIDVVVGRVLIESDAAERPRYVLRVEGEPCEDCQMMGGSESSAGEEATAGEETTAGDDATAGANTTAGDNTTAGEGAPAGEEMPAGEETPAGEEIPAGEETFTSTLIFDQPGVHTLDIPDEVSTIQVQIWGGGGGGGNQLGAHGGGAAAAHFLLSAEQVDRALIIWVGEGGSQSGAGGGGSFIFTGGNTADPTLLAAIAGGGGGASDGNSGRSWTGGRGGAGGWEQGQDGQDLGVHQMGTTYDYCREATGGRGGSQVGPGAGGVYLGTADGCSGQGGVERRGGGMTSRSSGLSFMCLPAPERVAWESAPAQVNGGGGGGGGGYFGGGSGGFVSTYCGGGGGGGSSWVTSLAMDLISERGQAQDAGLTRESAGAGRGGARVEPMSPPDYDGFKGSHGRIVISW